MVILVDTNIVSDVFLKREPYNTNAEIILTKCAHRQITGYRKMNRVTTDMFRSFGSGSRKK